MLHNLPAQTAPLHASSNVQNDPLDAGNPPLSPVDRAINLYHDGTLRRSSLLQLLLNPNPEEDLEELRVAFGDGRKLFDDSFAFKTVEPWTVRSFKQYLQREHNDENLYFVEEIDYLKATKQPGSVPLPPADLLFFKDKDRVSDAAWLAAMNATFVLDTSPLQVNLSHVNRTKLASHIAESGTQVDPECVQILTCPADPAAFEPAQMEIRHLLLTDAWPRYIHVVMSHNLLGRKETGFRLARSLICLALLCLVVGLCLGLHAPRWCLLASWPLWFLFVDGIVVNLTGVCPHAAHNKVLYLSSGQRTQLQCPVTIKAMQRSARRLIIVYTVLSLLATGITLALSWIVEAAVGKTLYNR